MKAVVRDGLVFVTDFDNHRVQIFGSDGTALCAVEGSGQGRLRSPLRMAISEFGLYVADFATSDVRLFRSIDRDRHPGHWTETEAWLSTGLQDSLDVGMAR